MLTHTQAKCSVHLFRQARDKVWNVASHPHAYPSESPGNWREHEIEPFPEGMKPPPFTELDLLMRDWVALVEELRTDSDDPFPERLARAHNGFERTHPFLDGNGRTGRLSLNLILARLGYPPAIVFKNELSKYLAAMRKADLGDYGPLGEEAARWNADVLAQLGQRVQGAAIQTLTI